MTEHYMVDYLRKTPLFANLNGQQLEAIASHCARKVYKANTVLFQEKEPGSTFYMVHSGSVKIFTRASSGEEKILSIFKEGESFGELSLIDGKPRSASAQTLEDSVLILLTGQGFHQVLSADYDICLVIMQELCSRLRDTNQHVHDLTFLDARTRVIKSLITLANKNGTRDGQLIVIRMTLNYDEVAQMAGVPKPVLMQVIRDLQEKHILALSGSNIHLNLANLRG